MAQKKRLAETLVEEGIITDAQLQSALQRQLIMGGKIGTNLVELKYIAEKQLDDILSKTYRIPYATPDLFLDIPLNVISSIPKEIAVRHKIIPIKKEQKNLTIAMENPNDIRIIDELSFMTGCRITTIVASEIRIAFGLEKYYDQPRNVRYIEIKRPKEDEFVVEENLTLAEHTLTPLHDIDKDVKPVDSSEWLSGDYDEEPAYLADYQKPKVHPVADVLVAEAASKPITFQDMVNKLINIDTRDNAIKVILDYISQHVENVIFLVTSDSEAKAWNAKCKGIEYGSISDLKISFGGPSAFLTVKNSEQPYYGEITSFQFDEDFLSKIGRKRPLTVYLVPIMVKTKMVSILYIDNGNKAIPSERIAEINSMIEKLSIVFEILVLKKKAEAKK